GDYVSSLGEALAGHATVSMWIPDRPELSVEQETHVIEKAPSRVGVARDESVAWLRRSALADGVAAWGADVVHISFGEGYPTAARLAADLEARVPVVATWHDPVPHGQILDRVQHAIAVRTMTSAAGVHVHCEALVPERFRSKVKVLELPAFPCPRCLEVTDTQLLRSEGPVVAIGRFAPYKGTEQLCAALSDYWRHGGERSLVVVGQGRVPASLRDLESRWRSLVTVVNEYVPATRLHEVLSDAAVCVMPYIRGTQSALPWLARAHGAHLIASDVGCIGEVTRRIGGRVVRPGSVADLVDALLEPPSRWRDIEGLPMPTFGDLADGLLDWYPRLSAA
ncbi:MAG TPA: glycosyltransferase family 4 protein, partial [Acidimicrobiales bacterium]|nr:glycosyltransferase family 4 protein [Acidimicrobiales bacterium]